MRRYGRPTGSRGGEKRHEEKLAQSEEITMPIHISGVAN